MTLCCQEGTRYLQEAVCIEEDTAVPSAMRVADILLLMWYVFELSVWRASKQCTVPN